MQILRYGLFITLCAVLMACSTTQPLKMADDLVGTWCELDEATVDCIGYMRYHEDGTFDAVGGFPGYDIGYRSYGKWEVDEGRICITPLKRDVRVLSTNEDVEDEWETELDQYCDEILSFNKDAFTYRDDGQVFKVIRVKEQ